MNVDQQLADMASIETDQDMLDNILSQMEPGVLKDIVLERKLYLNEIQNR